mgnify:CR=1 FL=1
MLHLNYTLGARDAFAKFALDFSHMDQQIAARPSAALMDQSQAGVMHPPVAVAPGPNTGMPSQYSFGAPLPGAFAAHGSQDLGPSGTAVHAQGPSGTLIREQQHTPVSVPHEATGITNMPPLAVGPNPNRTPKITAAPAVQAGLANRPMPRPLPTVAPKIAPAMLKRAYEAALAAFGLQQIA